MANPTTRNGFRKPDPGSDTNTWGTNLNAGMFDLIDDSLDGWTTISTTPVTLSSTQYVENEARNRILKYTGTSTGTITIPGVEKWYLVYAVTNDVVITTGGGTTATVKAGDSALVFCDGANCRKAQSNDFAGSQITNIATPTANSSATTKAYVDGLALAQSNLPGQNSGTLYHSVFSGGAEDSAAWRRSHPQSTSSNIGKVLKSTGTDGYPETALQWDWDGYQGASSKSANYTIVLTDRATLINCTNTFTLSLTAVATLGSEFYFRVANVGTGLITIDPNGTETIQVVGRTAATTTALGPNEAMDVYSDGSGWYGVLLSANGAGPNVVYYESSIAGITPTRGGAQVTRRLDTTITYQNIGSSLASNRITLPRGTYRIEARGPGYGCNAHQIRFQNITDGTTAITGFQASAEDLGSNYFLYAESTLVGQVSITGTKVFELQHWASGANSTESPATGAFGMSAGSGYTQIYATVAITRVGP